MRDVSTSLDITSGLLEDRRTLWVVAALIVVLFAIANLPWQLDDYDQAKQAFTSFEMVKEGHWVYQHTPHERVATKPPLVGWMSAALFIVTRSWEIAWKSRRGNCSRRVWTESAEPAAGHACAHRHAAGPCDFPDRPADLAKGPT